MISVDGIKKVVLTGLLGVFALSASAQIVTSGRVVYERKTNVRKIVESSDRFPPGMLPKDVTYVRDSFDMWFDGNRSAFVPIESEGDSKRGMLRMLTSQNTCYKDLDKNEKVVLMTMMGTPMNIKDSLTDRKWKITNRSRKIAGYRCRRAIWEQNDSTRIYAWFSTDVVPSSGPEGFSGLPGMILGLATEGGEVVYFAKRVEVLKPEEEKLSPELKKGDTFTVEALKKRLEEKMGRWLKPGDLDQMFAWY